MTTSQPSPDDIVLDLADPAVVELPDRNVQLFNVWPRSLAEGAHKEVSVSLTGDQLEQRFLRVGDEVVIGGVVLRIDSLDADPAADPAIRCVLRRAPL
jgi:hypothetical protein